MRIILFGAVGLAMGIAAGTCAGALKQKKVLTAELMARQGSIAAAQADSLVAIEPEEEQRASHGPMTASTQDSEAGSAADGSLPIVGEETHEEPADSTPGDGEGTEAGGSGEGKGGTPAEWAELGSPQDSAAVIETGAVSESIPLQTPAGTLPGATGTGSQAPDSAMGEEGPMRLAKIFGAMDADEAAKVLENLEDTEVQTILKHISDRKVAAILSNFEPARAATLSRVVMGMGPGGTG